jgi:hypothetical protein
MPARTLLQSSDLPWPVLLIFAAIAIAAMVAAQAAARRRREAMAKFASSLNLAFHPAHDSDFPDQRAHSWFRKGHSQVAYNRIEGRREIAGTDCALMMGDFRYVTGSGKNRQVHNRSYVLIQPAWHGLPNLEIRAEHIFDKIGDALGFDDIDFESEEFSRKFMVKSGDKRFAYAVVHPRMMEFLMACDDFGVHLEHGECLITGVAASADPSDFRAALGWAERFFGQWPDHLRNELNSGGWRSAP